MLTPERQRMILRILKEKGAATVRELAEATRSSEATVRRDLHQLEEAGKLIRFHGGAETLGIKAEDRPVGERLTEMREEKAAIGRRAAAMVQKGDCIYLDAGTTTLQMIDHLPQDIVVVTNGLPVAERCLERDLKTYLIGGVVKPATKALVGRGALDALSQYRFDKCFIGINGIHLLHGLTTPDPEEAHIKRLAMELSEDIYVLADETKFGKISFALVHPLERLTIITNASKNVERLREFQNLTNIEVVTA
ncbi:DeoR/GlpR family DNA-binding transcription regulator [Caenibacillus caldisaponilyticus]|uniref:DeoR/GlpR family DNA-binding transcription regulator n=1 Tax=Caenibacillus caldisaponilyticus TaxID=1674942 RepID=UPI0009884468|nr:DeoR/GlpR family DNA-binding transcription regulator [Caenibacillus caldisaponilyticus]